jgi:anti-sigma regulatory factor (Ser/Thr protein kinase)
MSERIVGRFTVASEPGNEREAMRRVAEVVQPLGLSGAQVERLKTAVAETALNAMEHGHHYQADMPVEVVVTADKQAVTVTVTDRGDGSIPEATPQPDLDAKLAGAQSPRGWGLFLVRAMVDEMRIVSDSTHHTVALVFHRQEAHV